MLTAERQAQLQTRRDNTNPRQLRQHIYDLRDQLFELPGASPESTQDVYLTLFNPPDSIRTYAKIIWTVGERNCCRM
jgi:hypothetical protein